MLDHVHIFHRGGLILWSKSFVSTQSPINQFIHQALIEPTNPSITHSQELHHRILQLGSHSLQYRLSNDFDLVFVVVYQRILQLTYISDLLDSLQSLLVSLYAPLLSSLFSHSGLPQAFHSVLKTWDLRFTQLLKQIESSSSQPRPSSRLPNPPEPDHHHASDMSLVPAIASTTATDSETIARNIAALKARRRKPSKAGPAPRPEPSPQARRKWENGVMSAQDIAQYDFSEEPDAPTLAAAPSLTAPAAALNRQGIYEVADYETQSKPLKKPTGLWARFLGRPTPSTLEPSELAPVLEQMEQQLMKKNVAREVAVEICTRLGTELAGRQRGDRGSSLRDLIRAGLASSLHQILTPRTSVDLILEVRRRVSPAQRPYTITFMGVNGVGKSTNLAKVAFWLLQNRFRVLIAACDTFRSGAVEQLRTHVTNLSSGLQSQHHEKGDVKQVELFEKGYGKDADGIAKEAIAHATANGFEVVLIDTAGRMQDNESLMRALGKLVTVNNPDKLIFVGEALVGNEAVGQLQGFNTALVKYAQRTLDGMILTKFDTIDEQVGAAVSMTFVSGQPIWFVGTGQTYTDLKALKVGHVVEALMRE